MPCKAMALKQVSTGLFATEVDTLDDSLDVNLPATSNSFDIIGAESMLE